MVTKIVKIKIKMQNFKSSNFARTNDIKCSMFIYNSDATMTDW